MAKDLDISGVSRLLGAAALSDPRSGAEIGAKAHALSAMAAAGAPTPDGFVVGASAFDALIDDPDALREDIDAQIDRLERATGRKLGDPERPLLLALRLSPQTWLPDLTPALMGLGAAITEAGARLPAPWGADPAVERRLLRGLAKTALGVSDEAIDEAMDEAMEADAETAELDVLRRLATEAGAPNRAPSDLAAAAISGMAARWRDRRAQRRRRAADASDRCALVVQVMPIGVDGGAGEISLYDLEDGSEKLTGEWRPEGGAAEPIHGARPMSGLSEETRDALLVACLTADAAVVGPRRLSFVIADGKPWIVGAPPLRASARAQVRIEVSQAEAGRITRGEALGRIDPLRLEEMLHRRIDEDAERRMIARGVPASPGAAAGVLAFSAEEAERRAKAGEAVVLICEETSPEDIHGLHAAAAVMTTRGGLTSHAAVVARGLDKPCVVGASETRLTPEGDALIGLDGTLYPEGSAVTVDGSSGEALAGALPTRAPELTGDFATLMIWADEARRLGVRANADTPNDAETSLRLGVDGIGLCRTEHMFVDKARITVMREMILADEEAARRAALERLLPMQRADFEQVFEIMGRDLAEGVGADARPVTIRLLDPPLHEFLPQTERGLRELAEAMGEPLHKVTRRAAELREFNPMLGKRGCRMGVAFPEIYEMQARAIFEAALMVESRTGARQRPEIMVPLVSAVREMELICARIDTVARRVRDERGAQFDYQLGIMVETPRAALRAGPLGATSAFFSFGTNDLTQMTYGLSRDDAGRLMRDYVERGVFEADPFQSLDQEGVGELMRIAIERGREANPELKIGMCGEHGGDPATIAFCEEAGFDYVSCSPFRAPIARLAAAQAALRRTETADGTDP